MTTNVEAYMTHEVHTIGADQTLESAKHLMYTHGIRHLPILDGGKLVGIISDRDIKLAYAIDGANAGSYSAIDSCTTEVYSAERSESLKVVTRTMGERSLGCCVVTDAGKVVGIFTAVDACRVLSTKL